MAIRPEFRWWILTVVVLGVLLLISALALDRPNVVWEKGDPHCPHCRAEVAPYSGRCQACREQYDWSVAPEEGVLPSPWSLSTLEADWVRDRVTALGPDVAALRVAEALQFSPEAAKSYLDHVGRATCGWCGGTGLELAARDKEEQPCAVCFGRRECIACRGERRARVGDEAAHRALLAYEAGLGDIETAMGLTEPMRVDELRRLTQAFVRRHAGTIEMTQVLFWPTWRVGGENATALLRARQRLEWMVAALETE